MRNHPSFVRGRQRAPLGLLAGLACVVGLGLATAGQAAPPPERLYGGIEIGSTGVKLAAFETTPGGAIVRPILRMRTIETHLIQDVPKTGMFNKDDITDTVKAVGELFQELRDKDKVPVQNIYVVGSSGLMDAKEESRAELVKAVEQEITRLQGPNKNMEFITGADEARLTALGVMQENELGQAVIVDVGGGNIKAGLLEVKDGDRKWVAWSLQAGTKSFTNQVQAKMKADQSTFPAAAEALRPMLVAQIKEKIGQDKRWTERKTVYLVGGIVWAVTSIFEPEMVESDKVALSVDKFRLDAEKLRAMPVDLKPDLTKLIQNDAKRTLAEAERNRALKIFPLENLIAGTEILLALSEALELDKEKSLYFDRQSLTAWLQGYILEKVKKPAPRPPENKEEGDVGKRLDAFATVVEDAKKDISTLTRVVDDARKEIGTLKLAVDNLALQLQKNQTELLNEMRKIPTGTGLPKPDEKKTDPVVLELLRSQRDLTGKMIELMEALRAAAAQQGKTMEGEKELAALRAQTAVLQSLLGEMRDERRALTALQTEIARTQGQLTTLDARLARMELARIEAERKEEKLTPPQGPRAEERDGPRRVFLNGRARFVIEVPSPEATLYVDDVPAPRGHQTTVEFLTPVLPPGRYTYTFRVDFVQDGKPESLTRKVLFSPNTETRLALPQQLAAQRD